MDIVGTVSFMAAAYGYYKAGVYVADTVDKSIRVYTFCRNAVGYIRRPVRYYLADDESVDSYPDIPPRPFSCSDLDKNFNYDENGIGESDVKSDPGDCSMSKTVADISEFKPKSNRNKSLSLCSEATEMYPDEFLKDVSWVMVKNPDYSSGEE